MSKVIMIGDMHLGIGYPKYHSKWSKISYDYVYEFLLPYIKEIYNPGDIVVQMGDLFDNRNIIPIDTLNFAQKIIVDISNIAPLHILVGNHDLWNKSKRDINTINMFKYIPNVYLYDETSIIEIGNHKLCMMPYINNKEEQISEINKNNMSDYLFCHSDLNGARMHLTSIANRNTDKIDILKFVKFKHVYSGHIHINQKNKNFTFVGSCYEMDRNDTNNQKGIYVLDLETGKDTFVLNNISPRFEIININSEEDIEKLDNLNIRNFIDLNISTSLVSNRKIRRKLEKYLKENTFENVKFIDDVIVDESLLEDVSTIDIINNNLDYDEMIKKHLNETIFDSDKIKEGVLNVYDTIINKYKYNND